VVEEPEDEEEQQLRALQLEDLEDHGAVGAGTSGVVNKVVHLPTGRTLALKVGGSACLELNLHCTTARSGSGIHQQNPSSGS
jgi:hypothetical protein